MLKSAMALFVGASVVMVTETNAQGRWQQQVSAQIQATGSFLEGEGFNLARDVYHGSLNDSETQDYWIELQRGTEYAIVGVCDEDCEDVDLEIFDGEDSMDSDYEVDDTPVLLVTPRSSGPHRIHVYMAECETEPCYYGVGVYGRGVASAARGTQWAGGSDDDGRWRAQVENQLGSASDAFRDEGFERTHQVHNGSLEEEEAEDFYVQLRAGTAYALIGVCDEDCDDIDLAVYDESGEQVDSDYETDDVPLVQAIPAQSGQYRVHVYMASCQTEPCFYGVGIFGRRSK